MCVRFYSIFLFILSSSIHRRPCKVGEVSLDFFVRGVQYPYHEGLSSLKAMLQGMFRVVIRVCRAVGRRCWEMTDEEYTEYAKGDVSSVAAQRWCPVAVRCF